MEALSGFLRSKHDFVAGKVAEGKVPNTPQLCAFLAEVCKGLLPLVSAEGVPDAVAADLRLGFESVGWDVKTNRPLASRKTPPSPGEIQAFLKKAAARFAPKAAAPKAASAPEPAPKPKKKLEVKVPEDEDDGLQFGAPADAAQGEAAPAPAPEPAPAKEAAAPAEAKGEAQEAQGSRLAKLELERPAASRGGALPPPPPPAAAHPRSILTRCAQVPATRNGSCA
eukprot:COSAG04_NODE_441_length_14395_cov_27.067711_13_plen_225_part_00